MAFSGRKPILGDLPIKPRIAIDPFLLSKGKSDSSKIVNKNF